MSAGDFGPRLSPAEYQRLVAELQRSHGGRMSAQADRELRRRELDLRIDYRLGRAFPPERRAALWKVQERVERRRLRLAFRHFMRAMLHKLLMHDTKQLAQFAADEFGKVLSEEELRAFLDLRPGETPALPVDREAPRA